MKTQVMAFSGQIIKVTNAQYCDNCGHPMREETGHQKCHNCGHIVPCCEGAPQ
jgi:exosome complex RNA-binding protein Csl4